MNNNETLNNIGKEEDASSSRQPKKNAASANRAKTSATAVQKNIETLLRLEQEAVRSRSKAEHIADKVTAFAGSTPFIILHLVWFGGWILINEGIVPGVKAFDPFPFSFLTLVVSLEAIFLTLLVLMSQNRMTKEADKRAKLDLQINMLDEQETTMILRLVQKIARHIGMNEEADDAVKDLCEETDISRLAQKLDENPTA